MDTDILVLGPPLPRIRRPGWSEERTDEKQTERVVWTPAALRGTLPSSGPLCLVLQFDVVQGSCTVCCSKSQIEDLGRKEGHG